MQLKIKRVGVTVILNFQIGSEKMNIFLYRKKGPVIHADMHERGEGFGHPSDIVNPLYIREKFNRVQGII